MIQTINTEKDLLALLIEVIGYLGWAFHPDNSITDYVRGTPVSRLIHQRRQRD